jgi:hypothetical protein
MTTEGRECECARAMYLVAWSRAYAATTEHHIRQLDRLRLRVTVRNPEKVERIKYPGSQAG